MLEAQTGYSEVSCKLEQSKGDKRLEEEAKSKQKKNFFNIQNPFQHQSRKTESLPAIEGCLWAREHHRGPFPDGKAEVANWQRKEDRIPHRTGTYS